MSHVEDRTLMLGDKAEELSRLIINLKNTWKEHARSSGHHEKVKFSVCGHIGRRRIS